MSRYATVALAILLVSAAFGPAAASSGGIEPAGAAVDGRNAALDQPSPAFDAGENVGAGSTATRQGSKRSRPSIAAVYPNPVAHGDAGEFVLVSVPGETSLGPYRLADEQNALPFPNATVEGTVAVTTEPTVVRNLTDHRVIAVEGDLSLANGGETVTLRRDGNAVSTASYRDAPEGDVAHYDDQRAVSWRPLGVTDRPVVAADGSRARAFVLPDAPGVPLDVIQGADDRILLAGYTFSSERIAAELEDAAARGVDVRVLLEGDPVGGVSRRQATVLDSLAASGVRIELLTGPRARYAYHHAKYAVADDRALVMTENWKPAGTGGQSSRGWGAVVSQPAIVAGLAETFRADAGWRDTEPWTEYRRGRSFEPANAANGTYPANRDPKTVPVERTRLLVTPDNAADEVVGVVDRANESVDVLQVSIGGPDQRFLRAAVRAARRGVDVRILLSGAWYVREDNEQLVDHLTERAAAEDLPIEAKVADPAGRFEKIHAKGVIVDGESVVLGSLNWNDAAATENRELLLHLEGEAVADYYGTVFESDWGDGGRDLPMGFAAAAVGIVLLAALVARRVSFGEEVGVG